MSVRGELDRLQEHVAKRLISCGDFATADIFTEGAKYFEHGAGKACGVSICVRTPMPVSASKYSVGPVFSKVAVQVVVERANDIARHSPSIASLAESVTKCLHAWSAPTASGYGKLTLDESAPWQNPQADAKSERSAISVNFTAQSVLG